MDYIQWMTLSVFVILLAASVRDIRKREIAVWMLAGAGILSLAGCLLSGVALNGESLWQAALSLIPGVTLLVMAYATRGRMGYGDGLMVLCIGPVFGAQRIVTGLFLAFFLSALVSVVLIGMKKAGRHTQLPFLPFITVGMGVSQFVF